MANWDEIKAAIQATIKPNGNQEITGQVLQNVLMQIANAAEENAELTKNTVSLEDLNDKLNGKTVPVMNLYENDIIDADKITYREAMFMGAKTSGTYRVIIIGKYLNIRREVNGITTILNSGLDTHGKTSVLNLEAVQGAKYFIEGTLTYLSLNDNELTTLDVSKCTALKSLGCSVNKLTTLDVSECTSLEYLVVSNNLLTMLNVSGCTALKSIVFNDNQLTTLDVSSNTVLEEFDCTDNLLTTLDISKCTKLRRLYCANNELTMLDVSSNTALEEFVCYGNSENLTITWAPNYANEIIVQLLYDEGYSVETAKRLINALPNATNGSAYIFGYTDIWDALDEVINNASERGWEVIDGEF